MNQYLKCPYSLLVRKDLSSKEIHVYLALLTYNPCFPSHKALCDRTGMSINTMIKVLRSLRKKRLISWVTGRKGKNNLYKIGEIK